MSETLFRNIEQQVNALQYDEKLVLIERLVRALRQSQTPRTPFVQQMEAMAADPEIQREIALIDAEFAPTEMDGLEQTW